MLFFVLCLFLLLQGTSRLISTDSEGISGSPPYLSPPQQQPHLYPQNSNYSSAAASLLAVLSDEPVAVQQQNTTATGYASNESQFEQVNTVKAKKDKTKPKAEPIKLKIKTSARLRTNADLTEQVGGEEVATEFHQTTGGRSTRRTATPTAAAADNVPVPGTANYELYRTLTESPTHTYSHPQYNHSHQPFESSANSATTAAHYIEPNHPALADYHTFNPIANISEIDAQNNSQSPSDTERGILPKKRRGRNKAAAKFETTAVVSPAPPPEIVTEEPVQKRQRGRRRHDDQQQLTNEVTTPSPNDYVNSGNIAIAKNQIVEPQQQEEVQPLANLQPKKRITAAAKKHYRDENPIQVEQQVIPISSLPHPVEETPPGLPVPSEVVEAVVPNRRGRKAKTKANQNLSNAEQMSQPEVVAAVQRPTRQTRHTANGNMTKVSSNFVVVFPFF